MAGLVLNGGAATVIERNIARHFGEKVLGEREPSALEKRVEAFAAEAMASKDVDTRRGGRRLAHLLATLDPDGDPELNRLELLWRAKSAGMPVGAAEIAAAKEPPAPAPAPQKWSGRTQRPPSPEMAKWQTVEVRENNARTDVGENWQITYYNANFIRLYYWGGSTNELTRGMPGGTMRLKYLIPNAARDGWLAYELVEDVNPRLPPEALAALDGYAPDPCHWLYRHERRDPVANPLPGEGLRRRTASARYGMACPYPYCTLGAMSGYPFKEKGDRWVYELTIHPGDYLLQLPCTKTGFRDTWYVEAEYRDAKGTVRAARVKLLWPAGNAENELAMRDRLPFGEYTANFPALYETLRRKWEAGDDPRFYADFVKPVLEADQKLLERTYSSCGSRPKILGECDADRRKFYRELPRMVNVAERLDGLRKDYLRALLEGRDPVPPKTKGAEAAPAADADELQLDEEEI